MVKVKIWGDIPRIFGIYERQKNVKKIDKTSPLALKKDVVSISNNAKDYQLIVKALKETPDIRQDRVNELKQKYDSGNYDVSGRDIAEKIIKSAFDKKV